MAAVILTTLKIIEALRHAEKLKLGFDTVTKALGLAKCDTLLSQNQPQTSKSIEHHNRATRFFANPKTNAKHCSKGADEDIEIEESSAPKNGY
jgi:hypothetical protein